MPVCDCGTVIQSGQQCKQCQLADRYSTGPVGAATDGGRTIVADEAGPSPSIKCGDCSAKYQGLPAARQCCTDAATGNQPRLVADGGEIEVCPNCGEPTVQTNVQTDINENPASAAYRCRACGEAFDEPDTRAPEGHRDTRPGLAGALSSADPDDLATDGGQYVRETGAGYQGIYSVSNNTVSIPLTTSPVEWTAGDVVWAVDAPADGGVVLTGDEPADPLGRYEVIAERSSLTEREVATAVSIHPSGIAPLDLDAGDSVRVYDHADGLLLVDPDDDPRVEGGDRA